MTYSIGDVAHKLNITIPTIRYYDREGLLPFVERTKNGSRVFKDTDIELLNIIQCFKLSGLSIKEIKDFIEWCAEGDSTLQQRYDLFMERKTAVEAQMKELKETLDLINHKCDYYKTAVEAGTEDVHKDNKIGNTIFE
ncbi:MerR family transcriptional regulator [Gracilibacillus phocaeensis]|uniref:MerR family transcriptional regulator n=1 Tax=Gracilibacillus phocaeensis TaxID=2042304 RepID=UPI00102FFEC5|nr:MerR family transcriptional regulator [Gracilibacillus phocaeensis]